MYRKAELVTTTTNDFELPFGGKMAEDNRWVMMAQLIPWSKFEAEYAENFAPFLGIPAKLFRRRPSRTKNLATPTTHTKLKPTCLIN